jgi:hypothetical protein
MKKPRKTKSINITKEQFLAFEAVRLSGVTEMTDTSRVEELSGLSAEQMFEILKHHDELKKKYALQE